MNFESINRILISCGCWKNGQHRQGKKNLFVAFLLVTLVLNVHGCAISGFFWAIMVILFYRLTKVSDKEAGGEGE